MIYKIMPQATVGWRDVWIGAVVTALLFEVGKILIGLYIGKSSITSSFAAAGSLVVLLVWVYYSAQIFLLGAEFTWVYANDHGSLATRSKAPAKTADSPASDKAANPTAADSLPEAQVPALMDKSETLHANLKQRAIVYAGTAATLMALRLLLKRIRHKSPRAFRSRDL